MFCLRKHCCKSNPLVSQIRFAGHNKWSKIKHTKGANDLQRAKQTSRLVRQIEAGIKAMSGETNPTFNHYLASALHAAKMAQIPKTKIEEAIKRGVQQKGGLSDAKLNRYEGIGPAGIAVIIEALVTNPAKTAAEIKLIFKKSNGSLGSVEYLFQRKGHIMFKPGSTNHKLVEMADAAIDAGADDIGNEDPTDQSLEIFTAPNKVYEVQEELAKKGYAIEEWGAGFIPNDRIEVSADDHDSFAAFLDRLEQQDEVVHVHHNAQ